MRQPPKKLCAAVLALALLPAGQGPCLAQAFESRAPDAAASAAGLPALPTLPSPPSALPVGAPIPALAPGVRGFTSAREPANAGNLSAVPSAAALGPSPQAAVRPAAAKALSRAAGLAARVLPGRRSRGKALRGFYDGSGAREVACAPEDLSVFLTADGRAPVRATLAELPRLLVAEPAYARQLNEAGLVRLVVARRGGLLSPSQKGAVEAALRAAGVSAPVALETVPLQSRPDLPAASASAPSAGKSAAAGRALAAALWPAREAGYLARAFFASMTLPTREEITGGLVTKGPAFVMSALWWAALFMPGHLVAGAQALGLAHGLARTLALLHMRLPSVFAEHPGPFAAAMAGSLLLETFHGIWVNTWQNFQKIIGTQRGANYQSAFNFLYMQSTTLFFRFVTWTVIASTVMPWHPAAYLGQIGVPNVIGTFIGSLGFFGLNSLYDKGRISRRARSWIQQGRDFFFLVAGTFLFSGFMYAYLIPFGLQQLLDIFLYKKSLKTASKPILYVADARLAASSGFRSLYPVEPSTDLRTPLRKSWDGVVSNPFVKFLILPPLRLARQGWRALRRRARRGGRP